MRTIEIPELALVALIGASGSSKSTLARGHFLRRRCFVGFFRGLVSDDENDRHARTMHSTRFTTCSKSGSPAAS